MKTSRGCCLAFLTLLAFILHLTLAQAHFQPSAAGKERRPNKRLAKFVNRRRSYDGNPEPFGISKRLLPSLLTSSIFPEGRQQDTDLTNSPLASSGSHTSTTASPVNEELAASNQGAKTADQSNGSDVKDATSSTARSATSQQIPDAEEMMQQENASNAASENSQDPGSLLGATAPVKSGTSSAANTVLPSDTLPSTNVPTTQATDLVKSDSSKGGNVPDTVDSTVGKGTSTINNGLESGQNAVPSTNEGATTGSGKDSATTSGTSQASNYSSPKAQSNDVPLLDTVNNTAANTLGGTPSKSDSSASQGTPSGNNGKDDTHQQVTPSKNTNIVLDKEAKNGTVVNLGGSNDKPIVDIPATGTTVSKNATQVAPVVPVAAGSSLPLQNDSPLKRPLIGNDTAVVPVTPIPNTPVQNSTVSVPPVLVGAPIKNDTVILPPIVGGGSGPGNHTVTPPSKDPAPIVIPPIVEGTNNTVTPPIKETTPTTGQEGEATPKETAPIASATEAKHDHSAFDYADQQKLLLPAPSSNGYSITAGAMDTTNKSSIPDAEKKPEKKPAAQVPIGISIPSVIAPTGAGQAAVNSLDVVAVSILFKDSMDWTTLASSPELVAQIFHFMPGIIADCVSIQVEEVITVRLQRQVSPLGHLIKRAKDTNSTSGQTLYVANVPASVGPTLQQKINDPQSNFYTQPSNPVAKELVSQVEPSYNIMQNVSVPTTSSDSDQQGNAGANTTLKKALIAIGSILAVCILIFFIQYLRRFAKQKSERGSDRDTRASSRQNYRDTIQTFGSNARNDLRETWSPNGHEQRQVLHGQLTEAWDHAEIEQVHDGLLTMGYYEPQMMEPNSAASLRSARDVADPFSDLAGNKASQETERSNGGIRNTLLSHMQRTSDHTSDSTNSSRMTEAQRILQDYFDSRPNSQELEQIQGEYPVIVPNHYNEVYERPAQHTPYHASGPRSTGSRSPPQRKISISKSSVGQPTMQRNSQLI